MPLGFVIHTREIISSDTDPSERVVISHSETSSPAIFTKHLAAARQTKILRSGSCHLGTNKRVKGENRFVKKLNYGVTSSSTFPTHCDNLFKTASCPLWVPQGTDCLRHRICTYKTWVCLSPGHVPAVTLDICFTALYFCFLICKWE